MKKRLLTKSLLLLCILMVGVGTTWADTYTYTFNTSSGIGNSGSSYTLNGVSWTITYDSEYKANEDAGFHVGSGKKTVSYLELKTSGISGTITKVKVKAKGNGTGGTISTSVNGTSYTVSNNAISNTATDFEFTGSESGEIDIKLAYSSAVTKNFYISSIEVTYSSAAKAKHTATFYVNGAKHSEAEVEEDADITFPTGLADIDGYSFTGYWVPATISGTEASLPATAVNAATMGTSDVTYHAVYALGTPGTGGTITLTNDQIKSAASGKSSYATTYDVEGWTGKYLINSANGTYYLQLGYNTSSSKSAYNSHLTTPECTQAITSVTISTNNSTASGRTFYLCDADDKGTASSGTYGSGSTSSANGSVTISVSGNPTQFHIYPDGTAYLSSISITYGSAATLSDYCTTIPSSGKEATTLSLDGDNATVAKIDGAWNWKIAKPTLTTDPTGLTGINWASSATDVATVNSNGEVTPLKTGTSTISAKYPGNDDYQESNTVSYTLTVYDVPGAPTFSPADGTTFAKGSKVKITPNGMPDGLDKSKKKTVYTINGGAEVSKEVNQYNEVAFSEAGTFTLVAYNTYTVSINGENVTLKGASTSATYTVVEAPTVSFDQPNTVFGDNIDVNITASDASATIYYTTDGTTPTTSSTAYSGTLTISATTKLQAIAATSGITGAVATVQFTKNTAVASTNVSGWIRINSAEELADAVGKQVIITNRVTNVAAESTDKYAMPAVNSSNTFDDTAVKVSIVDGTDGKVVDVADESKVAIFNLQGNYDSSYTTYETYSFYQTIDGTNKFLCANTAKEIPLKAYDSAFDDDYNATITISDGKENSLVFTNTSKAYKNLRFNQSAKKFRYYDSGQQGTSLYYKGSVDITATDLDESSDATITTANGVTVNLYRQLQANVWNAVCLPFSLTSTQATALFGDDYELQEFTGVTGEDGGIQLNFTKVTDGAVVAGVPYIVKPSQTVQRQDAGYTNQPVVVLSNVDITATEGSSVSQTFDGETYKFTGNFAPVSLTSNNIFLGWNDANESKFFTPTGSNPMRGFRAYFTLPSAALAAKLTLMTDGVGETTGISSPTPTLPKGRESEIYTLDGRKVSLSPLGETEGALPRGIYVQNGKKFVVK